MNSNPTQAEIEAALKEMPANNAGYDKWGIWAWYHKDVLRSALSQPEQQEAVGDANKQMYNALKAARDIIRGKSVMGGTIMVEDAIRAYEALTATKPAGWRTIDSAPADCDILLYCPALCASNEERIEVGYYKNTKGGTMHSWATHWQPLPAPPAEDGEA